MGMSVIESLSEQIIALCEEKELQYQAGIITNGYLLTPENAEKLKNIMYDMHKLLWMDQKKFIMNGVQRLMDRNIRCYYE